MHNPIRHTEEPGDSMIDEQSTRIPAPESFPPDESPADAAGSFEEVTRKQLNLLRERTFNPELRKLVDRIRVNEPTPGHQEIVSGIDELTEDELQLNLYRLYYKARNISDNNEINISFDPFKMIEESPSGDIKETLAAHVTYMMRHLSLSPFALLSYDITAKGYIPSIHDFAGDIAANIVISLKDSLFQKILSARDGILVYADELRDDHYLNKIFSTQDGSANGPIYFIMINQIVDEVVRELSESGAGPFSSFLPSALLMILLPENAAKAEPVDIARIARERLSLPLFMLNDNHSRVFSLERYDDLSYIFSVLDYFFNLFLLKKDRVGVSLHVKSSSGTSTPFIMKYIISKLNNKLYSDSVIINVLKERLIILTESIHLEIINQIFEEYNKLFKDSFVMYEFHSADFRDSHEVIQKLIIDN
jgi:hypothetical protein